MEFCTNVALQKLHEEVKDGKHKNKVDDVTVSPLGMCVILHMMCHGAIGATSEQLLQFLGVKNIDDLISKASSLTTISKSTGATRNYNYSDDTPKICNFNAVLVRACLNLKKDYQDIFERVYQANIKSVDFGRKDQAVKEVNEWAKSKTNGLIQRLLPKGALNNDRSRLMHANGLYFKGKWLYEFDPNHTKQQKFDLLNEANQPSTDVYFMEMEKTCFEYASFNDYTVLKMLYKRGQDTSRRFAMVIILPNKRLGLPDLVEKFRENPNLLSREQLNLVEKKIDVLKIPKFKHSYTFVPSDTMEKLGLTLPFDPQNVRVSRITQRAEIECNEIGTEVECTTYDSDVDLGFDFDYRPPPPPEIKFIADHPFMFMIKEDISDTIFFLGVVCDPS